MRTFSAISKLFYSVVLVLLLYPIFIVSGFFIRNRKKVVFGCHLSKPAGNIFYYYKHCIEQNSGQYQLVWVASNKESYDFIASKGYPVVYKYSFAGIFWCLTAGYYCYSSYVSDISYFLSKGVRGVNVWHGTPLKKIEFDIDTGIYSLRYKYKWIFKIIQPWIYFRPYKVFVSSRYEEKCFKTAFCISADEMYKTYPPRLMDFERVSMADGYKHILIAPTFRDGAVLEYERLVDFVRLNEFARDNDVVFHVKAHPSDVSLMSLDFSKFDNIHQVDRLVDVYSVVQMMDAVITDYSSIFFDCGYVGVPFFLHCPDVDFYNSNCRGFYFDAKNTLSSVYSEDLDNLLENLSRWLCGDKIEGDVGSGEFLCHSVAESYPLAVFK
ncbi:CDP-glycerol glycerophosphotransferase family protein [Ectopseudomonas mendocina]|uniref:CDP-glycerol glycerophosphotransferase family protein n=1 Tax=Ectopseudomonas mendocina TaxID=300 RepID=A0ABZ2RMC5_ECTME